MPSVALSPARALKSAELPNRNAFNNWGHIWGHVEIAESVEALCRADVWDEINSCSRTISDEGLRDVCVTPSCFQCLQSHAERSSRVSGVFQHFAGGAPQHFFRPLIDAFAGHRGGDSDACVNLRINAQHQFS